jgi:predicted transcriptional regulator
MKEKKTIDMLTFLQMKEGQKGVEKSQNVIGLNEFTESKERFLSNTKLAREDYTSQLQEIVEKNHNIKSKRNYKTYGDLIHIYDKLEAKGEKLYDTSRCGETLKNFAIQVAIETYNSSKKQNK